jgi:cytidylate kinase
MNFTSIAIDGPAGAGKSTLARKLAEQLGYIYVDTGAIYRTVALKALWEKANPANPAQVVPLLEGLEIHMGYEDGVQKMYLEGEDVSGAIRRHKVSGAASQVSAIPEVRAFLLEFQRKLARESSVVMDGRDIGTVVLPNADVKIFLTAAPEARARRRLLELEQRGETAKFDTILRDIKERDYQDEHRPIAPLKQAADAVLLDTTDLDLGQSMSRLLALVKEKIGP